MSLITAVEARSAYAKRYGASGKAPATLLRERVIAFSEQEGMYDIFLSHSSSDYELILGVHTYLESHGFRVYVDWIEDPQLNRQAVTKENAERLRKRMRQSRLLVYVFTANSSGSKWMPWELGYFDGLRPGKVSVLPVANYEGHDYKGQEYLGLYPRVEKMRTTSGAPSIFLREAGALEATNLRTYIG